MRWLFVVALVACKSSDSTPAATSTSAATNASATRVAATDEALPAATGEASPAGKPPDDMDEKMRHCPLALEGAASSLENIDGGVRFVVKVPDTALAEVRRRAHHIVDFAARKTRAGHGGFDGKGGGRMKNCPVVTDDVTIATTDIAGGAQLDVTTDASHVDTLRSETRLRASKFPFTGATITQAAH